MSASRLISAALFFASTVSCRPQTPKGDFFKIVPETKKYSVSLDLSQPKNYAGIPAAKWFPMGDREFCAIQGIVATDIKLPDDKRISEEFNLVYIDRDADGIFHIRADSLGWLRTDKALTRLQRELHDRASDVFTPAQYTEREGAISAWMTSWSERNEMYEGFRVHRAGYELEFKFFTILGPQREGIRFCYEIRLREPGPKKPKPKPRTDTFEANGITYQVPSQQQSTSLKSGQNFSYSGVSVSISEKNGQLTVNGKDAGLVKSGDSVIIDDAGLVLVNGLQRATK